MQQYGPQTTRLSMESPTGPTTQLPQQPNKSERYKRDLLEYLQDPALFTSEQKLAEIATAAAALAAQAANEVLTYSEPVKHMQQHMVRRRAPPDKNFSHTRILKGHKGAMLATRPGSAMPTSSSPRSHEKPPPSFPLGSRPYNPWTEQWTVYKPMVPRFSTAPPSPAHPPLTPHVHKQSWKFNEHEVMESVECEAPGKFNEHEVMESVECDASSKFNEHEVMESVECEAPGKFNEHEVMESVECEAPGKFNEHEVMESVECDASGKFNEHEVMESVEFDASGKFNEHEVMETGTDFQGVAVAPVQNYQRMSNAFDNVDPCTKSYWDSEQVLGEWEQHAYQRSSMWHSRHLTLKALQAVTVEANSQRLCNYRVDRYAWFRKLRRTWKAFENGIHASWMDEKLKDQAATQHFVLRRRKLSFLAWRYITARTCRYIKIFSSVAVSASKRIFAKWRALVQKRQRLRLAFWRTEQRRNVQALATCFRLWMTVTDSKVRDRLMAKIESLTQQLAIAEMNAVDSAVLLSEAQELMNQKSSDGNSMSYGRDSEDISLDTSLPVSRPSLPPPVSAGKEVATSPCPPIMASPSSRSPSRRIHVSAACTSPPDVLAVPTRPHKAQEVTMIGTGVSVNGKDAEQPVQDPGHNNDREAGRLPGGDAGEHGEDPATVQQPPEENNASGDGEGQATAQLPPEEHPASGDGEGQATAQLPPEEHPASGDGEGQATAQLPPEEHPASGDGEGQATAQLPPEEHPASGDGEGQATTQLPPEEHPASGDGEGQATAQLPPEEQGAEEAGGEEGGGEGVEGITGQPPPEEQPTEDEAKGISGESGLTEQNSGKKAACELKEQEDTDTVAMNELKEQEDAVAMNELRGRDNFVVTDRQTAVEDTEEARGTPVEEPAMGGQEEESGGRSDGEKIDEVGKEGGEQVNQQAPPPAEDGSSVPSKGSAVDVESLDAPANGGSLDDQLSASLPDPCGTLSTDNDASEFTRDALPEPSLAAPSCSLAAIAVEEADTSVSDDTAGPSKGTPHVTSGQAVEEADTSVSDDTAGPSVDSVEYPHGVLFGNTVSVADSVILGKLIDDEGAEEERAGPEMNVWIFSPLF
ncbi:hypothetical protein CEUSTIGMA_g1748.t1 [Chlamydomonas eustigma]|uniref:Sfi1 spindle body domain-containing protein n=1 Tax=Chlamydomonas eustigma TaxID=1157962 RepID=A0A250WUA3_9CHLO|nr:hypothetical protein CEUSTIGMA_g1748.t1 [Chlamydomonas eustigma]|eukprot:GAX74299.1 hypothetical protein CEUSTIGMA_g1748.t1 [Chlamydomonas eustigma]